MDPNQRYMTEAVAQALEETLTSTEKLSRDQLVQIGKRFWPHTFARSEDPLVACQYLLDYCEEAALADISSSLGYLSIMHVPDVQIVTSFAIHWTHMAFPTLAPSHKYAAALMATSMSPELADEVTLPFPAFLIEVPGKMLYMDEPKTSELMEVTLITVQQVGERIIYGILSGGLVLYEHGLSKRMLLGESPGEGNSSEHSFLLEETRRDQRLRVLVKRLIVGLCLSLTSQVSKPVGKGHGYSPRQLREASEPLVRSYLVNSPVKVDCRPLVKEYMEGLRGSSPSVQVRVRAHWQRVPYGPGRLERKWVRKESYWRGPLGAPIATHTYEL